MENTKQQVISREEARQQGLKHYFTGKPCKHGHVAKRFVSVMSCVECQAAHTKKRQQSNPEANRVACRKWRKKTRSTEEGRQYLRDLHRPSNARYKRSEKGKEAKQREAAAREADPARRTRSRIRCLVKNCIISHGGRKAAKTEEYLGCTVAECRAHLESLFLPGMSWDNHGEWHIDHIRPCASFDFSDQEQIKECMHYTNLQPLWAKDNLSKSDTW